ncbi:MULTISPECIES: hypothetical protein [Marinobacter]|jgi:hypothetical protein|uniref:hypothetical protein n=1 Tax=Marinobacter TaxID=2742 RepID=UPI0011086E2F|nr:MULTISPECIES: hypothetical protein [Marinobacter]
MKLWKIQTSLLTKVLLMGLLLAPGLAAAQSDLDITMRMVADDEELDSSFVQEMQIPDSVSELEGNESFETLDAGELSTEAQELSESLSLQARETRDALGVELPGETGLEEPSIELPGAELPEPDLPIGDLPDTDLDLLEDGTSTLDGVTGQ